MRKAYLDNIRWGTVWLVVIYHVFYMYNAEGVLGGLGKITDLKVQYYDVYQYIVYPWFMLILFLISGISARYALEKQSTGEFIKNRTTKLLVPSTIGLFVFWFLQGYISMSLSDAFIVMRDVPGVAKYLIMALSGTGVLWYIQMLWIFSLVLIVVRIIEKDRIWNLCKKANILVLAAFAVLVWTAAQIFNTPVIVVYRFGLYGIVFFTGYFLFSHDEVVAILKKYFFPLLALTAVLGISFCVRYFGENFADVPVNRTWLFTFYGWFACLTVLGGMARFGDRETAVTRWMNQRSYGLYLFHYPGISAVALFLGKPGHVPSALVYLISLFAGCATGYGLNAVISRIPFFRWAVMGMKGKKEKNSVSG